LAPISYISPQKSSNIHAIYYYSSLHLDTSTIQLAAQKLYRKNGFKETGEVKVRRGFTEIFFEKRLT